MYKVLDKARAERGGIAFETEEAKFIFNAERRIERVEPTVRNDAHKLIEECMIMANVAAARFVEKRNEPALYRVHDRPSDDHISALRSVLSELGLTLGGGNKPQPKDYAVLMDEVSERPDHEMLQTMLLRSMKQAIYDPENRATSARRWRLTATSPRRSAVIRIWRCTARSNISWPKNTASRKSAGRRPAAGTANSKRCCSWANTAR